MTELLPFGVGAWFFISVYLCSLLLLGWLGFNARKEDTLQDFYLAGRGFGFFVLLLTLYATQYSGNSVFGNSGATYRLGFAWLVCVHYMVAIIVFYLAYAPQIHLLASKRGYVTPADFLGDRFASKGISLLTSIVMIIALSNYLLAQLMAMGRALQGLAGPLGDTAYNTGVLVLAFIMVLYGTLGGMRAIAWTDAIQGCVLMIGFLVLLGLLWNQFGPLAAATERIAASTDAFKVERPPPELMREWLSYILVFGMGGALYPQAIQRAYAARSGPILNKSLAAMAFMPFITALIAVIAGIYALAYIPGLEGAETDQVLSRLLRVIQEGSLLGYAVVVVIFSAVLAALMSTADSAMMSISSMFTKDIYSVYIQPEANDSELTRVGKFCSWALVLTLIVIAILLKNHASLIGLMDRKMDLLVQLVPAFMLSVHMPFLKGGPVFIGLIVGLMISLCLAFGSFDFVVSGKVWGLHPGLIGLAVNATIAIVGSLSRQRAESF